MGVLRGNAFDFYTEINGKLICNACNVRPEFSGEHRCFGSDGGATCECQDSPCRLHRREVTLSQLMEEDEMTTKDTT